MLRFPLQICLGSRLRRLAINLALLRSIRAWGTAPWASRMLVKVHLDWLPLEPGHTDQIRASKKRCRQNCVPAQRFPESSAYALLCLEVIFVTASHQTGLVMRSMTQSSIIVGIWWGKGWALAEARAEAQALFDFAGHRLS